MSYSANDTEVTASMSAKSGSASMAATTFTTSFSSNPINGNNAFPNKKFTLAFSG